MPGLWKQLTYYYRRKDVSYKYQRDRHLEPELLEIARDMAGRTRLVSYTTPDVKRKITFLKLF
jgi:hypothetical protein